MNHVSEDDDNGVRKALIVGVSDYQDKSLEPLPFCKNDAEEMYKLLTSPQLQFEIPDSNKKMMGEVKEWDMRRAIIRFFKDPGISSKDTLLFYFAGHGVMDYAGDVFMASSDTDSNNPIEGGFAFYELTKLMNGSYSTRIITILDCCHSGALELARGDPNEVTKAVHNNIEDRSKALRQGNGKCLLAASESTQRAYNIKEKNHGIFTYYLLEGLKGKPQYVDDHGNVTVDRLADYVYDTISNLPPGKKPNQMPIRKVEGGGRIILAQYPNLARTDTSILAQYSNLERRYTSPSLEDTTYTIKGSVKYPDGKPVSGIKIQAMCSDQQRFQDRNDILIDIVPVNDSDGTFEVTFDLKEFKDGWLQGHPDIYLIVRNSLDGHVIYKTEVRKEVRQDSLDLIFDITINPIEEEYSDNQDNNSTLYDPFQGNNDRVAEAFMRLRDVAQFVPGDIQRKLPQLISSINQWVLYTREDMWRKIEYDGPQVPRYPWRDGAHSHKLSWEKM